MVREFQFFSPARSKLDIALGDLDLQQMEF